MGVIKCRYASGGVCTNSTACTPIFEGYSCPRLMESGTLRWFNPARDMALVWNVEDVKNERPHLTDGQAYEVLENVWNNHDADYGVSWETLRTVADILYPKEDMDE